MRVWLVTDHYPPQPNGHAVAVAWWARALARHGLEVTVIADAWRGVDRPVWEHDNYREVRLPTLPLLPSGHPLAGLRGVPPLAAASLAAAPDLLHAHGYGPTCAQLARALSGVPLVVSVHSFPDGSGATGVPPVRTVMRWLLARMVRRADLAVAPSRSAARRVGELAPGVELRVIPTGVEAAFEPPAGERSAPVEGSALRVLYVGRVSRDKGFEDVRSLARRRPEAEWRAVGAAGEVDAAGLTMLGHLPPVEVARAMRRADVVLAPSLHETQGLAVYESIAVGTPVAAPRGSAQAEVVREGENGALYDAGDLDDAWRAIVAASSLPRSRVAASAAAWRERDLVEAMQDAYAAASSGARPRSRTRESLR
jgi:glycosyltransferase involved in cell wall biosynthesis